jgi:hypothetical protein
MYVVRNNQFIYFKKAVVIRHNYPEHEHTSGTAHTLPRRHTHTQYNTLSLYTALNLCFSSLTNSNVKVDHKPISVMWSVVNSTSS